MSLFLSIDVIDKLEDNMLSCVYKKYLGIECPGCGMQRAFYYLIRGEFIESLKMFPALIPLMAMMAYLVLHIIFKFKKGHKILLFMFILNLVIIMTNYIFKLIFVLSS
jgi:hypothetical protein